MATFVYLWLNIGAAKDTYLLRVAEHGATVKFAALDAQVTPRFRVNLEALTLVIHVVDQATTHG